MLYIVVVAVVVLISMVLARSGVSLGTIREVCMMYVRRWVSEWLSIGRVVKHSNGYTDVIYYDGSERYVIRYKRRRGLPPFKKVYHSRPSGEVEDVTDEIKIYSGPCHNFHNVTHTPHSLGYPVLRFVKVNDEEVTFDGHDERLL